MGEQREADEDGDGERAADPGGGDGAAHRPAGDLPDDGAEHAAAVEREAGQQVEDGDDEVGDHQAGEEHAGDRAGLDGLDGEVEDAGQDEGEQGADEGEHELAARGLGLLLDLGDAAEELELDAADGEFEAEGGDGVGEFVDEDGGVEGDREEEGDEVAGGAEFGQDAVELAAEDPGDEGGDEEPAGGDVDGYAEGTAHEDAAAGLFRGALGGGPLGSGGVRAAGIGAGLVSVLSSAPAPAPGSGSGSGSGSGGVTAVAGFGLVGVGVGLVGLLGSRPALCGLVAVGRVVVAGPLRSWPAGVGLVAGGGGPGAASGVVAVVVRVPAAAGGRPWGRRPGARSAGRRWPRAQVSRGARPTVRCPAAAARSRRFPPRCPLDRSVSRPCRAGGSVTDGMRRSCGVPPGTPRVSRLAGDCRWRAVWSVVMESSSEGVVRAGDGGVVEEPSRTGAAGPEGRRRGSVAVAPALAVAVAGGRLHDVPAAVPVPGDRPAARDAQPRRRRAARWCTRCWSGCSTCRPPSARRRRRQVAAPAAVGPAAGETSRRSAGCSPTMPDGRAAGRLAGGGGAAGRALLRAGGPDAARARRAGAVRGDRAGVAGCGCAATSTGSTSRRRGEVRVVDYKTGRRPREPSRAGAVPDEVLRAGAVAADGRGAAAAAADVPGQRGRADATPRTRRTCARVERKLLALWEAIERATRDRRLAAAAEQAVRLVRPPGALPGVRRHSPAVSAAGDARGAGAGEGGRAEDGAQGRMGPG